MIVVRRDSQIFDIDGGWFRARWHFSFDRYRDPENMGWGALRVFNDDRLRPGAIWPMHPHRDIEGITYVVEGTFRHEDDIGTGGVLPAGSVQRMTLGRGALHSEQNGSETEPMRFLQLWIMPRERGLEPSCEQRVYTTEDRTDRLLHVLSPDGGDAVLVHQDASMYISRLTPGTSVGHEIPEGSGAYLYVIEGACSLTAGEDEATLGTGDAVKIKDVASLGLTASETTELALTEIPMDQARWISLG